MFQSWRGVLFTRVLRNIRELWRRRRRRETSRARVFNREAQVPLIAPRKKYSVVDTNFLRTTELERLLGSCDDTFVLLDEILFEMMKSQPFVTVKRSAALVARNPERFVVAKSGPELVRLSPLAKHDAKVAIQSKDTIKFLCLVGRPFATYQEIGSVLQASKIAKVEIGRLTNFWPSNWSCSFSKADANELRQGHLTGKTLWLLQSGASFIARNILRDAGMDFCTVRPSDVTNSYAFRLPLSKMLHSFVWTANGRPAKREERRKNDLVDAQIACTGSLFDRLLTRDRGCEVIERLVRKASHQIAIDIDNSLLTSRRRDTIGFNDESRGKFGFSSEKVLDLLAQPVERARPRT
jgi:hypothetical protein